MTITAWWSKRRTVVLIDQQLISMADHKTSQFVQCNQLWNAKAVNLVSCSVDEGSKVLRDDKTLYLQQVHECIPLYSSLTRCTILNDDKLKGDEIEYHSSLNKLVLPSEFGCITINALKTNEGLPAYSFLSWTQNKRKRRRRLFPGNCDQETLRASISASLRLVGWWTHRLSTLFLWPFHLKLLC